VNQVWAREQWSTGVMGLKNHRAKGMEHSLWLFKLSADRLLLIAYKLSQLG